MNFEKFKEAVIAAAKAMGIEEYELYYQASEETAVGIYQQEVDEFSASVEGGVCLRCIVNGKMGYAATEDLSLEQAESIVRRAYENALVLESEEPVFLNPGGIEYTPMAQQLYPLPTAEELIFQALDTQKRLYAADPGVVDGCSTQGVAESVSLAICNSKGLDVSYHNQVAGLVVGALVEAGEEKANDYQIKLGQLDTIDKDALVNKAVKAAKSKLGGEVAPTMVCPVVFDPEAMSDLLQVFSGIFSSEAAQKGLSRLADKEGNVIASSAVTIMDDPFHKDNPMPIPFDAEGSATYAKAVVEKGVLNTLLYNLKTANMAGKKTTGNAAKASYSSTVGVRPFTMYLAPGEFTEEQLLKKAGNGVYINTLNGLHAGANSVSGDFSLQSAGWLIENGVKTKAVNSFTVAGNFYEMLKNITAVADNVTLPMAMGMIAFGAPSTLVENLSIAGK